MWLSDKTSQFIVTENYQEKTVAFSYVSLDSKLITEVLVFAMNKI